MTENLTPNFNWTPELAYVIGLITTDGSLSIDGRHINLTSKDLEQIKTFASILCLTNTIGKKGSSTSSEKKYFQIQFGNVKFYKFLLAIGLTPNKTKTLGPLKIPDKYFVDFLRGHLDGDGSIVTYVDRYNSYFGVVYENQRLYLKFISASNAHLVWLSEQIEKMTTIKGSLTLNGIWNLSFSKKDSIKLLKWIYYKPSLPCLTRKREIAIKVLRIIQMSKRKVYSRRINVNI